MNRRVALLGFLPWIDEARGIRVGENPSALVAEAVAGQLAADGLDARFIPVGVSESGIRSAMAELVAFAPDQAIALGQTRPTMHPRVERAGQVPGEWAPSAEDERRPWTLAPDAEALSAVLNELLDPLAQTGAFAASDDPGGYYCDHLCVELARDARRRGSGALFLHISPVDAVSPAVRDARLSQFTRQTLRAVEWCLARETNCLDS